MPLWTAFVWASVISAAIPPSLKWSYQARSTLYAPPLVADMHPSSGLETVISDAEARTLRCIDSSGKELWSYKGGWTRRLTSSAAFSRTARTGRGTLVVGGSDGRLCCIDAETGRELWNRPVGEMTWGGALWADLQGDGRDDIIAGTEQAVLALDADGKELWAYKGKPGDPPLDIRCSLSAADADSDGRPEVFGVDKWGPFCLDSKGVLRWRTLTGDDFLSAPLVVDADRDGRAEVYCSSDHEPSIIAFDAHDGRILWRFTMLAGAEIYPGSSFAAGDLDRDGTDEIVGGDIAGHIYVLRHDGTLLWSYQTLQPASVAMTLGDVDGDDDIEVLAAGGDHGLYCLDSGGRLKWRWAADFRLILPATLADIDLDGKTDILVGGSDRVLRCLTVGGAYNASRIPWPSRRFDTAQTGAAFPRRLTPTVATVVEPHVLEARGDFEQPKSVGEAGHYPVGSKIRDERLAQPLGWTAEPTAATGWHLDKTVAHGGATSVCTQQPMRLVSPSMVLDRAVRAIGATVYARGTGAIRAEIRWFGAGGLLREEPLKPGDEEKGWRTFALKEARRPLGAEWVTMVLRSGTGQAWWDDAQVVATSVSPPNVRPLVNQVGYDCGAPKRFTVQSNFRARTATFSLRQHDGTVAFSGTLKPMGRIRGRYDNDWGYEYWRGDFTAFDRPGRYRIEVALDSVSDVSWPFEIGENLIWDKTARPAYRFFYYQRCGCEVPGFHRACHTDDGVQYQGRYCDLSGGWHDAGDYNKYYNAPYVLGLVRAYGIARNAFDRQDQDGNKQGDFFDEILWGGDHCRRMIAPDGSAFAQITSGYGFWGPPDAETDNTPSTGDERTLGGGAGQDSGTHHAAMARIARYAKDKKPWVEAAERGLQRSLTAKVRGLAQFTTAVDLYAATGDRKYADLARQLLPGIGANEEVVEAVRDFDALVGEDHSAALRKALVDSAEELIKLADNPFGVVTNGPADKPNYFGTPPSGNPWRIGTNMRLCHSANIVALAYQYSPDPRYLTFIYDQINWILGNNPCDVSLVEGVGSAFVPTYHNRLMFAGVPRAAVPGSVINGITFRAAGEDIPYLDMTGVDIPNFSANECWLPHNTIYLNLLANLQRIRAGRPASQKP